MIEIKRVLLQFGTPSRYEKTLFISREKIYFAAEC
jgi:hypothetical protein